MKWIKRKTFRNMEDILDTLNIVLIIDDGVIIYM